MNNGAALCRELWVAIESRPELRVESVVLSSTYLRWSLLVRVPWDRYGREVGTLEDLERITRDLERYRAAEVAAAAMEVNAFTSKVERQTTTKTPAADCGQLSLLF